MHATSRTSKILLIPGWAGLTTTPDPLCFELRKQRFEVEVLPSHCLTPDGAPDAGALSLRLEREPQPVWLMGLSMGGMLALETAAHHPERIRGLLLLSTTARFCTGPDYRHGFEAAGIRSMIDGLHADPLATLETFFALAAHPEAYPPAFLRTQAEGALTIGTDALIAGLHYIMAHDLRDRLPALQLPALVFHGRKDAVIPWRAGLELSTRLPQAHWLCVPHSGHDAALRLARTTARHIAQFCHEPT